MARVKGGPARSTPLATRFPAAMAFTRSRGETPVKSSSGGGARRRSASPAAARSRQSRSRSRSSSLDDQTIVAASAGRRYTNYDGPAAQLLQETRSVSLEADQADEDDNSDLNEGDNSDLNEDDNSDLNEDDTSDLNEGDNSGQGEGEHIDEYHDEQGREDGDQEAKEEEREQDVEIEDTREPELAEEDADEGPDESEFEVEKICSFQLEDVEGPAASAAGPAVLLEIKWRGYPRAANTLEPEANVQASAAPLLYKFWAGQGGRDRALGLSPQTALYVPFRILEPVAEAAVAAAKPAARRRRGGADKRGRPKMPRYLVQWVGYDVDQATPETERKLRSIAPELLDDFLSENAVDDDLAAVDDDESSSAFSPRFPE